MICWRSHFDLRVTNVIDPQYPHKSYNNCSAFTVKKHKQQKITSQIPLQVILFEIDCAIFYTNLHELFCQFISWTNWVNSGRFMDNCWISCQVMADMKKAYNNLIIINLYARFISSLRDQKSTKFEKRSISWKFHWIIFYSSQ